MRNAYVLTLIFIYQIIFSQQSCINLIHLKSKYDNFVYSIKETNSGYLITGSAKDSLYFNSNLVLYNNELYSFLIETDQNFNVINSIKFTLSLSTSTDYINCVDVLKDNNYYYLLINWAGNLKLNSTTTINGDKSMILVKVDNSNNVYWYYYMNNSVGTGICFDNHKNITLIGNSPTQSGYNPSSVFMLNLDKSAGQIKKSKIGVSYFNAFTGKILFKNNQYFFTCKYKDSLYFGNQKLYGTAYSEAIVVSDTNFNFQKYSTISALSPNNVNNINSIFINDFVLDNSNNIILTGKYLPISLYVNDTIRLSKSNSYIEQMFILKLNPSLNFLWAKQENQNTSNNPNYNMRSGFKVSTNSNDDIFVLSYFNTTITLGNMDTYNGTSLILVKYNSNGQYLLSEKVAGMTLASYYTLHTNNNSIVLSANFIGTVSVCQNTITATPNKNTYIAVMDKLTEIFSNEKLLQKINIFPNPANSEIYISNDNLFESLKYNIYDLTGKIILNGTVENNTLHVNDLSNGVYLLKLSSNSQSEFFKVTIIH
ncbi:MAG TPA: T9SS type A sorting domain-containing protein [Bacteroidia bacterium]|nr:T9SS type A sorting domain-containing protein [Bacteroidia bacterium]